MLRALRNVDPKEAEFALSSVTRALLTTPSGGDLKERINGLSGLERTILEEVCEDLRLDPKTLTPRDAPRILEALNDTLSDIVLSKANINELEQRAFDRKPSEREEKHQPRPRLFISSSGEAMPLAKALRYALSDFAVITTWADLGSSAHSLVDALVRRISSFDFAVLVLAVDDVADSRFHPFSKSNIAFEAGLFVGRLGRDRTFLVFPETLQVRVPSDLAGAATLTYDASLGPEDAMKQASYKIVSQMSRFGRIESKALNR